MKHLWLMPLIVFGSPPAAQADRPAAPRRVYVIHAGIHTILANPDINISAKRLDAGLQKRGVQANNIVVMDNPFPKATWKSMFPREALEKYLDSLDARSDFVQDSYLKMHNALAAKKVGEKDEVIWIGHSAGGQLGMTIAHVAHALDKYPVAKQAPPYRLTMVVTLGTPVGSNMLPRDVTLRNYFSPDDNVVRLATKTNWFTAATFGFKGKICPCSMELNEGWKARIFYDIEHSEWTKEERVIDRIMAEQGTQFCPAWCSALGPRPGLSLAGLLCQALDRECHISVEDAPKAGR